jgi:hypothetical protein
LVAAGSVSSNRAAVVLGVGFIAPRHIVPGFAAELRTHFRN